MYENGKHLSQVKRMIVDFCAILEPVIMQLVHPGFCVVDYVSS